MRSDCLLYCSRCDPCKSEKAQFVKHQTLTPFEKGSAPFQVWCLDLIVGLPDGSQGQNICVVCVDVFSKFVVASPLFDKSSDSLATFFYQKIICEFSVPRAVRCDNGREFLGSFDALLKQYNVYRFPATPYYPQALGQVEVVNRTIKLVLRKLQFAHPGMFWDDALCDIVMGLRIAVHSAHGYSPFEIIYNCQPSTF